MMRGTAAALNIWVEEGDHCEAGGGGLNPDTVRQTRPDVITMCPGRRLEAEVAQLLCLETHSSSAPLICFPADVFGPRWV